MKSLRTKRGLVVEIGAGLGSACILCPTWGPDGVPLAGAITMLLPLLVVPVVSLLTQPPKPEIIATAFGDKPSA